jgi:hypothetical protein
VPEGYLDVAGLDYLSWRELADRHVWLLDAIRAAGPGSDVRMPGVRAAALALVAVLAELDLRARVYEATADHRYWCSCGFTCTGLAAFDKHMDPHLPGRPGRPGSDIHDEITEAAHAERQAVRAGPHGGT